MECTLCLDKFNGKDKIPLILTNCGHTYCTNCLKRLQSMNKEINCPQCRTVTVVKQVLDLKKNFYILDNLQDQNQQFQPIYCKVHTSEAIKIYCSDCKQTICALCVITHAGHTFQNLEEPGKKQKNKLEIQIKAFIDEVIELKNKVKKEALNLDNNRKTQLSNKEELVIQVNKDFNIIMQLIEAKRNQIINTVIRYYQQNLAAIDNQLNQAKQHVQNFIKIQDQASSILQSIQDLSYHQLLTFDIQSSLDKLINWKTEITQSQPYFFDGNLQNQVGSQSIINYEINMKQIQKMICHMGLLSSQNQTLANPIVDLSSFQNFNLVLDKKEDPQIYLFSPDNQILQYSILQNKFKLSKIKESLKEFSDSVAIPNFGIIISGGGSSNQVLLMNPKTQEFQKLASMIFCKERHCSVYLESLKQLYSLGGLFQSESLHVCERFDIQINK